ncbi:MAG: OmpA family protein [Proteobacteria bacterium]|nr:OmpA family protein [Pseudomonadota bacterium]
MKVRFFALLIVLAVLVSVPGAVSAETDACRKAVEAGKKGLAVHDPADRKALNQAMAYYQEALRLCPEVCRATPQICANMANAHFHLGRHEEAIDLYKQALLHNPDYGTPYFGLGEVYLDMGLLGSALDSFLKAYMLDRRDAESRTMAAKVFTMICERYKGTAAVQAEDVALKDWDRRRLEDKLLMDQVFSEKNRRLFYCERKSGRVEFNLRDITFETARAVLKKEAFQQIDLVGQILKDNPALKVILEGHTDSSPFGRKKVQVSPDFVCSDNLCLSQARAEAVKQALATRSGVDPKRITVKAFGDTRPLVKSKKPADMARNRRVTLVLDRRND